MNSIESRKGTLYRSQGKLCKRLTGMQPLRNGHLLLLMNSYKWVLIMNNDDFVFQQEGNTIVSRSNN